MTIVAVADTGPLIHLAEIDSLALLSLIDQLYVPRIVFDELEAGGIPAGFSALEYTAVDADTASTDTPDHELDPDETAALAVAVDRDATLLTDDLAARKRATARGVDVHGSIGLIALGYSRGSLDRDHAASRMRALQRETSLFVSDAVVERGIEMLTEG